MYHELTQNEYARVYPVFDGYLREPLLYAVLDGHQPGKVWVDDPDDPSAALVWSCTECVYAAGGEQDPQWHESLRRLVLDEVMPAVKNSQRDFSLETAEAFRSLRASPAWTRLMGSFYSRLRGN